MEWFIKLPTTGAVLLAMRASAAAAVLWLLILHPS